MICCVLESSCLFDVPENANKFVFYFVGRILWDGPVSVGVLK